MDASLVQVIVENTVAHNAHTHKKANICVIDISFFCNDDARNCVKLTFTNFCENYTKKLSQIVCKVAFLYFFVVVSTNDEGVFCPSVFLKNQFVHGVISMQYCTESIYGMHIIWCGLKKFQYDLQIFHFRRIVYSLSVLGFYAHESLEAHFAGAQRKDRKNSQNCFNINGKLIVNQSRFKLFWNFGEKSIPSYNFQEFDLFFDKSKVNFQPYFRTFLTLPSFYFTTTHSTFHNHNDIWKKLQKRSGVFSQSNEQTFFWEISPGPGISYGSVNLALDDLRSSCNCPPSSSKQYFFSFQDPNAVWSLFCFVPQMKNYPP